MSAKDDNAEQSNLTLQAVTDGTTERGIPVVKYIEGDISEFANQFSPPASAELLIGAYTDLFSKFKTLEARMIQKSDNFKQKIPEIEESLTVVTNLKNKSEESSSLVTRYSLADAVFGKAEIDTASQKVGVWLGANVMLEYTYDEAIELLSSKGKLAKKEFEEVKEDLAFTRNQIITAEVSISRIYNWDVRRKREARAKEASK